MASFQRGCLNEPRLAADGGPRDPEAVAAEAEASWGCEGTHLPKRAPTAEERWCAERRKQVRAYLKDERLEHRRNRGLARLAYRAVRLLWAIESAARPGWVGWRTICGDLPSDYLSARCAKHPRTALRAFAKRWLAIARCMERGRAHPSIRIGDRSAWPKLAPLLRARAQLLAKVARTNSIWQ